MTFARNFASFMTGDDLKQADKLKEHRIRIANVKSAKPGTPAPLCTDLDRLIRQELAFRFRDLRIDVYNIGFTRYLCRDTGNYMYEVKFRLPEMTAEQFKWHRAHFCRTVNTVFEADMVWIVMTKETHGPWKVHPSLVQEFDLDGVPATV